MRTSTPNLTDGPPPNNVSRNAAKNLTTRHVQSNWHTMSQYRVPISNLHRALPQFGQEPPRLRIATDGDSLRLVAWKAEDDEVVIDPASGDLIRRSHLVSVWETDPDDPRYLLCTVEAFDRPYRPA